MNTTNQLLSLLFYCMIAVLGCKKSTLDQSKIDYEKFTDYITDYSQSPMSRCRDVYVNLSFQLPDVSLPSNLFEVTPSIGGKVVLSNNGRRITIKNPDIKHNVDYIVKFNIGLLTQMPNGMQSFTFPLLAEAQSWDINMQPPINQSMDDVTYSGEVKYGVCEPNAHVIEESLIAMQGNQVLRITWDHGKSSRLLSKFTIHDIQRKDEPDAVDLTLSMDALNVKDKAILSLAVPSKSDFSFNSLQIVNNQHLKLIFTDPLLSSQPLNGIINVKGREVASTKINKNIVEVFFEHENYGYFDLNINPGIKNLAGYDLKDSYQKELFFTPPKPRVTIAEQGNILPPSNRWELPINLVSASGFRLRLLKIYDDNVTRFYQENTNPYSSQMGLENLGRIVLDTVISIDKARPYLETYHSIALDRVVRQEPGALYKVLLSIPKAQNSYPCQAYTGRSRRDMLDATNFDQPWMRIRYDYDYYEDEYYYGDYYNTYLGRNYYGESDNHGYGNPCNETYAAQINDSRLLMCTDIGLVAKYEPEKNSFFMYCSSIASANPIASAKIELYNVQGREIGSGYTNGQGMVDIQLQDQKAFLAKASYNGQATYLAVQDAKALSLSTFQVEGKDWNSSNKVFFYGDRDVWRPGDTIYLQSIVYSPENYLPTNLPVAMRLFDPNNTLVKEWPVSQNQNGIYDCRFSTHSDDPTGYWKIEMKLGGKTYRHSVRVETIRPNRLKMQMDFSDQDLLTKSGSRVAPVTVKWMHGLEAKGLKTEVVMLQRSLTNPFGSDYINYVFDDINKAYDRDLGMVKEGITNNNGVLDFTIPVVNTTTYPSIMQFNFQLRAFEKGGAFSNDTKAIKYSPYTHYIGAKFPGGATSNIQIKNTEAIIVNSLDEQGRSAERAVNVKVEQIDYNWWYQFGTKGNYSALSNYTKQVLEDYDMKVGKSGGSLSLKHFGRLLLTITDKESGHSISRVVYSYKDGWKDENEEVSQLEVLPLLIEQTEYEVGEQIVFDLPAMQQGNYLITIENGGSIVHKEVRQSQMSPTKVYLPVTPEMAPTAYIHVHLMQAWDQYQNDRPLRLFGIKPIKVFDQQSVLNPRITMPHELKTDEAFNVSISEQDGRAMSYTLAIVDEGLLDITQFKTPDPWSAFFGKEGLNIKTWDMYREIFQRFLGEYTSLLAVGGDGSNMIEPSAKARRFKPVVKFVGPFTLGPGEAKSHTFTIDNYAGSVRAMVVATDGKALGRYEQTASVTKPLMLYATLPRVIGPDETMKLPVTVFTMEDAITSVTASVQTSDNISIVGEKSVQVAFDKAGEQDIFFDIKTEGKLGVEEVVVSVKSGNYSYQETIRLDLRASAPRISSTVSNIVPAGSSKTIDFDLLGLPGTNSAQITLSKGLNFSFASQVDWLSNYPHGCLEQTVSRVFPQLYLYKMNLLDHVELMKYRQQFTAAIQKLRFMQLPNGGFSYWPGGNTPNNWGTSYALEFLIVAKQNGYDVPQDMIEKCVNYQYKSCESPTVYSNTNRRPSSNYSTISQAYKLYTLAQAGKPNYAAMNRLRLIPNLHNTARWMLAHSFILLGEEKLAVAMIDGATAKTEDYRELSGTFGSRLRDQAIIARVLLDRGDKVKAKEVIDELAEYFKEDNVNYLSTQDRAQAMITFAKFVSTISNIEDSLTYDIVLSDSQQLKDQVLGKNPHKIDFSNESLEHSKVSITNTSTSDIYTSLTTSGQPLRDDSKAESSNLSVDIKYFDEEGEVISPSMIEKGKDFVIQYSVTHSGIRDDYENLALTGIFPSGWEIINQRLNSDSRFDSGDSADYTDVRDDRVMLYFDLSKGEKKVFKFKLNATYEGRYWAAPAFCEAMYDAKIRAKTQGFWAEVK